MNSTPLQPTQV